MNKVNDYQLWQRPVLDAMANEQVQKIYQGALRILERTGIDFYLEEAVDLMAAAGAWVENKKRVRIPAHMVKEALASAPTPSPSMIATAGRPCCWGDAIPISGPVRTRPLPSMSTAGSTARR